MAQGKWQYASARKVAEMSPVNKSHYTPLLLESSHIMTFLHAMLAIVLKMYS